MSARKGCGTTCPSVQRTASFHASDAEEDLPTGDEYESDYSVSSFPDPSFGYKAESLMPEPKLESPCLMSKTFGGKAIFDASGMPREKFEPWVQKNTSWVKESVSSSIIGPQLEEEESGFDYSDPQRRQRGFDPYVHVQGLKQLDAPYKDFGPSVTSTPCAASPYRDFQPLARSSPCAPAYSHESMPPSPPCSAVDRKARSAWRYGPIEEREQSFLRARTPPSPRGTRTVHPGLKPEMAADDSATSDAIKHLLDEMEFTEMSKIKKDLKDFQKARRRLIFDATHIKPLPTRRK